MDQCDALIVGGGPAGSTSARMLRRAGWDVIVLDRARFPRDKVCGGWITPEVFPLLDLTPDEYRASGRVLQEITGFRTSVIGSRPIETRYARAVSYAVRRCEFDDFLLRRADVRVLDGTPLTTLERRADRWVANDRIEAPVVVGAGGHFCPVARHVQGSRDRASPVVAKELEFSVDAAGSPVAGDTPELFFCRDFEGYGWCVRKDGFLNIGIGRRERNDFAAHVKDFITFLSTSGLAPDTSHRAWRGHAYHAMGAGVRPVIGDGVLLVGDAAGLAYPESGEGIRPAIESGRLAAEILVAAHGRYRFDDLLPYAKAIEARHGSSVRTPSALRPAAAILGRALLRSPAFTRHFVLDRWFLRSGADQAIQSFVDSTYDHAASLGGWDRASLERTDRQDY